VVSRRAMASVMTAWSSELPPICAASLSRDALYALAFSILSRSASAALGPVLGVEAVPPPGAPAAAMLAPAPSPPLPLPAVARAAVVPALLLPKFDEDFRFYREF